MQKYSLPTLLMQWIHWDKIHIMNSCMMPGSWSQMLQYCQHSWHMNLVYSDTCLLRIIELYQCQWLGLVNPSHNHSSTSISSSEFSGYYHWQGSIQATSRCILTVLPLAKFLSPSPSKPGVTGMMIFEFLDFSFYAVY